MRQKVLALLSVLFVLGILSSLVSAETGTFRKEDRARGVSAYVQFELDKGENAGYTVAKEAGSVSRYYVTLTRVGYRIDGVPLTFTTTVGANDLVFRPYTATNASATNNVINFRYASFVNNEIRKSVSYGSPSYCEAEHEYHLKASLSTSSATSSISFDGRFTP